MGRRIIAACTARALLPWLGTFSSQLVVAASVITTIHCESASAGKNEKLGSGLPQVLVVRDLQLILHHVAEV